MAGCACLCAAAGACSSSSLPDSNPFAEATSIFSKPDWAGFSGKGKASSVVTADDLVGPDGSCAGRPAPVPASAPAESPVPQPEPAAEPEQPATDGVSPRTPPASPASNEPVLQPAVGLALGLSECDVVQRAGNPDHVDLGKDERGERSVVMTYTHGERAGIYRFREGRLFTIERVAAVEEPKKPVKPKAAPKPARRVAKPAPASSYADPNAAPKQAAPAWPAPSQPQKPAAQGSPWPATPQQQ